MFYTFFARAHKSSDSFFPYTSHASRVFIGCAHARKLLHGYVHHGTSNPTDFGRLLGAVRQYQPALTPLLKLIQDEDIPQNVLTCGRICWAVSILLALSVSSL